MAPMGIRLSPLGVAVFCLLGVGIIYHLYAGVISSRIAALRQRRTVDLRELLALSVEAAVQGGREVKRVREENVSEKSKGKTKDGASEKLALGDVNSHRKMHHLIKDTFPFLQVRSLAQGRGDGYGVHVVDNKSFVNWCLTERRKVADEIRKVTLFRDM